MLPNCTDELYSLRKVSSSDRSIFSCSPRARGDCLCLQMDKDWRWTISATSFQMSLERCSVYLRWCQLSRRTQGSCFLPELVWVLGLMEMGLGWAFLVASQYCWEVRRGRKVHCFSSYFCRNCYSCPLFCSFLRWRSRYFLVWVGRRVLRSRSRCSPCCFDESPRAVRGDSSKRRALSSLLLILLLSYQHAPREWLEIDGRNRSSGGK